MEAAGEAASADVHSRMGAGAGGTPYAGRFPTPLLCELHYDKWAHRGAVQETACASEKNRTAFLFESHAIVCIAICTHSFYVDANRTAKYWFQYRAYFHESS